MERSSQPSVLPGRPEPVERSRRVPVSLIAMALCFCAADLSFSAQPPSDPTSHASTEPTAVDTVTIEAKKKEVEREVSHFVFSVPKHYLEDSLSRWNIPICPLVAGLTHDQGEFVLARLSQIAIAAKAPLAGEHCKPNFYIVVTHEPDVLLKKWHARDRHMFVTRNGQGYINDFLRTPRPVRVWYNTDFTSSDGVSIPPDSLDSALVGTGLGMTLQMDQIPTNTTPGDGRTHRTQVQTLASVIVIVDVNRLQGLSFGQLTDYIAMAGLAEINLDARVSVPTILTVFRDNQEHPPQGLSSWDQAFLRSLYTVNQASVVQIPMMKGSMLKSILP